MSMKKLCLLVGLSLLGCGTDDGSSGGPEVLDTLTVPPKPENGLQIITAPFDDIQAGGDYEVCTWTDAIFKETTDVKSTLAYQTEPPGHHVVLFYTLDKQPPGTQRVCTDTDMASFRYLTGNGSNGAVNSAPGDLVFRIPEGAQLVINQHFLNASDEVLRGQSAINVNFADAGTTAVASSSTAFVNTGLQVEQGESTQHMHCTIDKEFKLWYFIPHMHRWGSHIKVDLTQGGEKKNYFDLKWEEQFTFHPPELRKDPSAPLTLHPGDELDVDCSWNNTEGRVLPFGFEMCVVFGQFVDDQGIGSWACDGGRWVEF
jgi:hypothetical protein